MNENSELFTDLDTSGTWNEGEPFVDCYFDTSSAISLLSSTLSEMTQRLTDSLASYCASPELDPAFTQEIASVFLFDLATLTFDTLVGLKVTGSITASCDTSVAPLAGDIWFVGTTKPLTPTDIYLIQTSSSSAIISDAEQLKDVKVVPNPYVVTSAYESNIETKELQFHNLPQECTIRIFTIAGELLRILEHREGSMSWRGPAIEAWDLRTYNNQEVAFGIYIFHVEAEGSDQTFSNLGKFAVIR